MALTCLCIACMACNLCDNYKVCLYSEYENASCGNIVKIIGMAHTLGSFARIIEDKKYRRNKRLKLFTFCGQVQVSSTASSRQLRA